MTATSYVQFVLALLFVLALIGVAAIVARRLGLGHAARPAGGGDCPSRRCCRWTASVASYCSGATRPSIWSSSAPLPKP